MVTSNPMSRVRTAILRGGLSDEYTVSLATGASVLQHIDRERFHPLDVVITKTGEWLVDGVVRKPEQILPTLDVACIALHGTYGEDGTVQRLIERYGVPYTGSGPYASGIAMHKALTKEHVRHLPIKLPQHRTISRFGNPNTRLFANNVAEIFGPEYVIKPIASGSSVGVRIVNGAAALGAALDDALRTCDEVIIEERIIGREATCGVIERYRGQTIYALPPIEIIPPECALFFDAQVKYDGSTREVCPATFSYEIKSEIEKVSKSVHETLGLSQYSRSDFIIAKDGVYFLEVNTLPGLTSQSLLPKAISAVGGTYTDFITHLLTDAIEVRA